MNKNRLKLNNNKTEFLQIMSPHQLRKFGSTNIVIGETIVQSSSKCRNLGVIFDCHLSMSGQVSAICKKCNFHLRQIKYMRKYLTTPSCRTAIQSLVLSNTDYCNSILYGAVAYQIARLHTCTTNPKQCSPRNNWELANFNTLPPSFKNFIGFRFLK